MAEGLATRSSRGHRTICLPIAEEAYSHAVNDPAAFRRWIDGSFREGAIAPVPKILRDFWPFLCSNPAEFDSQKTLWCKSV